MGTLQRRIPNDQVELKGIEPSNHHHHLELHLFHHVDHDDSRRTSQALEVAGGGNSFHPVRPLDGQTA
jgi:hypothetical protein